jgi:hypothetical protein
VLSVLAGAVVGLVLCEVGFHYRDRGAFPHLNVYVPDATMGVRLRPGATERVRVANNAPTEVRINADGLRGGPLPPPSPAHDEIVVVGDSQVFGLGVEETQTFSAELARRTKRPVVNAGVPTYGPEEYNRLLAELLPKRKPGVVVWTVNLANDLFEAAHPNTERHAVWDGWAVRKETAPSKVVDFPGRSLLFRDSHLVFAWRRWVSNRRARAEADSEVAAIGARRDPVVDGTPSEGTYRDLLGVSEKTRAARAAAEERSARERGEKVKALNEARSSLRQLEVQLDKVVQETIPDEEVGVGLLRTAVADPGDIVRVTYAEGARPIRATAEEIKRAAETRKKLEAALRAKRDTENIRKLTQFDALAAQVKGLTAEANGVELVRSRSPLLPHLERAKALAAEHGARLVVLVLPLDVMVSKDEWKKYGTAPIDMSATRILAEDVVAAAESLGATAVDAHDALAAAEPGAFLDGDLHMTPKGHEAVAVALKKVLDTKSAPPAQAPLPGARSQQRALVPPKPRAERSPAPTPDELAKAEWRDADTGCRWQLVREWVRLRCKRAAIEVTTPGRGEAMVLNLRDTATLLVALPEGDAVEGRIVDARGERRFVGNWPLADESPWFTVAGARPAKRPAPVPSERELQLCACQEKLGGDCAALYGAADGACFERWRDDCAHLVACARGDRASAPTCPSGQTLAGAPPWCR